MEPVALLMPMQLAPLFDAVSDDPEPPVPMRLLEDSSVDLSDYAIPMTMQAKRYSVLAGVVGAMEPF